MKKSLAILSLTGLMGISAIASADTILGIYVGAGVWQADVSGEVGQTDTLLVDVADLGMSDQDNSFFYAALEHPVPVIPNIRLQYTSADMSETGTLTRSLTIDDVTFSASTDVTTDFDASHIDAVLYYELLDNWLNLDFGLTIRQFDGAITVRETNNPLNYASEDLDFVIPLLYLKGQIDLPFTGFYVSASGNAISYDDASITDYQAAFGYLSDGWVLDMGFELGYRVFNIEVDDVGDIDADIEMDGAYLSLNLHF